MEVCLLAEPAIEYINANEDLEVKAWSPWVRHEVSMCPGSIDDPKYGGSGGTRLGGPIIRSLVFQATGPSQPEMHVASHKTGVQGMLLSDREMAADMAGIELDDLDDVF